MRQDQIGVTGSQHAGSGAPAVAVVRAGIERTGLGSGLTWCREKKNLTRFLAGLAGKLVKSKCKGLDPSGRIDDDTQMTDQEMPCNRVDLTKSYGGMQAVDIYMGGPKKGRSRIRWMLTETYRYISKESHDDSYAHSVAHVAGSACYITPLLFSSREASC